MNTYLHKALMVMLGAGIFSAQAMNQKNLKASYMLRHINNKLNECFNIVTEDNKLITSIAANSAKFRNKDITSTTEPSEASCDIKDMEGNKKLGITCEENKCYLSHYNDGTKVINRSSVKNIEDIPQAKSIQYFIDLIIDGGDLYQSKIEITGQQVTAY